MKYYGISLNVHDHSISTLSKSEIYTKIIERFSRIKYNSTGDKFFKNLEEKEKFRDKLYKSFIKELEKLNLRNNDRICFSSINSAEYYKYDKVVIPILKSMFNYKFKNIKPNNIYNEYKLSNNLYYIDHHVAHTFAAIGLSKFDNCDILAWDGFGVNYSTIFINKHGNILDYTRKYSVGRTWKVISKLFQLNPPKFMGLSAFGKYNNGIYNIIHFYFKHDMNTEWLERALKLFKAEDVAHNLQKISIEIAVEILTKNKSSKNLCISGGIGYNGIINEYIIDLKLYDNVFISPSPSDSGLSFGCLAYLYYKENKKHLYINSFPFNGRSYTNDESIDILKKYNLKYTVINYNDIYKLTAKALYDNKIIGWFQDKSEVGKRALGNRSILANPFYKENKDRINHQIKFREDFRPFAPAILEEFFDEYFESKKNISRYMSRVVKVKTDKIPAVTHIDNTARVQTVPKSHKKFYNLIDEFYKLSNVPILLNTSFNSQEPIVETPEDAIKTFLKTDLDILVINNIFIEKIAF